MNGGGLVLFVVLFYAGALRELSQFAAVDVDGDLAAKWLQKKSGDRRGICRTSCATSLLLAGGALANYLKLTA